VREDVKVVIPFPSDVGREDLSGPGRLSLVLWAAGGCWDRHWGCEIGDGWIAMGGGSLVLIGCVTIFLLKYLSSRYLPRSVLLSIRR